MKLLNILAIAAPHKIVLVYNQSLLNSHNIWELSSRGLELLAEGSNWEMKTDEGKGYIRIERIEG